jgi:hypothetical protein
MVNPDADNVTSSLSTDSIATKSNIPESCHKHSVVKTRSVRIVFEYNSYSYVNLCFQ